MTKYQINIINMSRKLNKFSIKDLAKYQDQFNATDVLLLSDVDKKYGESYTKNMILIP